jgi:hypothetical protein
MSRDAKLSWRDWNPGLDNGHWTLGMVLGTLPGAGVQEIPEIIRVLENPESPAALPGAITLARHDAVHALLGRGLKTQDEGFVIGFTMGAANGLTSEHLAIFRYVSRHLYPSPYAFSETDMIAFELGVETARKCTCRDLQDFPFEDNLGRTLHDLRRSLGINVPLLRAAYQMEQVLVAGSTASRRLDVDAYGVDPSSIKRPEGQESDWMPKSPKERMA